MHELQVSGGTYNYAYDTVSALNVTDGNIIMVLTESSSFESIVVSF
jgi:hypothetical protein